MTTINTVTFNMKTLEPVGTHRNIPNEEPGSDESFITDMGYTGLVLRMTGYEKTLAKYDEVINEFMKPGSHTLVYRTGWQFSVYSTQLVPMLDIGIVDNFFPYELTMLTSNPYRASITETTRTKTITANNQTWTQDNSANDIDTDGSVDAVPDIQVTGGVSGTDLDISQLSSDSTIEITSAVTAGQTFIPAGDTLKNIYVYVSGLTDPPVTATLRVFDSVAMTNELGSKTQALNVPDNTFTFDPPIDIGNKDLMYFRFDTVTGAKKARFYMSTANPYSGGSAYLNDVIQAANDFKFQTYTAQSTVKDAEIYNTEDTTIKCAVTNDMLYEAIHKINTDGSGMVEYNEDFSTGKYRYDGTSVNCSCDHTNNELDIADDGYIFWKCDAKYPITGIPTLTSRVNITTGLPTIQISSDGSTWYNITTAIVDDVSTIYELDSSSLSLKGLTEFYWRYDCVKAGAATCSIKSFELDVDIVTIDVEHPKITANGVSTFRCDQESSSGMNCDVALSYRDRSWPA